MSLFQGLPGPLQGVFSLLVFVLNTILWCTLLFLITFLKMVSPLAAWRRFWGLVSTFIANSWIFCNNIGIRLTKPVKFDVHGLTGLDPKGWYLVIANHQSWLDIVVLQKIFFRKVPFIKFFLKKELIWVPLLGQAWWALDFPFMKRYSKAYLKKHPERKGQDWETTRRACAKFKHLPVAIMNFVEGTRFTREKAQRQESPYTYLLKPKAAGIAFVLGTMGENLSNILNVTIAYPGMTKSLWAFMCGRVQQIKVVVETIPITPDLLGDYLRDVDFQRYFQAWLNDLWTQKELLIKTMIGPAYIEGPAGQ